MQGTAQDIRDLIGKLNMMVEKYEEDSGNLIQQLLKKVDELQEENDKQKQQLVLSQASMGEIIQYIEDVQQKLKVLHGNLIEEEKPVQKVLLPWWKVLLFVFTYMLFEISSNAIANRWPTNTPEKFLFTVAIFLICLGVFTYFGSGLSRLLQNGGRRNE